MFLFFFLAFFVVFHQEFCGFSYLISFFDKVSNLHNRILTNQKRELVKRNCQWNCMIHMFAVAMFVVKISRVENPVNKKSRVFLLPLVSPCFTDTANAIFQVKSKFQSKVYGTRVTTAAYLRFCQMATFSCSGMINFWYHHHFPPNAAIANIENFVKHQNIMKMIVCKIFFCFLRLS